MPIEDGIRYDGYWKYQEALEKGQFKNGSIFDGWYKADGSMNYLDNWGAIPGTEEVVTLGNNGVIEVGRYGTPGSSSAYVQCRQLSKLRQVKIYLYLIIFI